MRLAGSHPTLRAALLTTACAAASSLAAAASPPLSPQLTFASTPPTTQARDYGTLLQLEYDNREAMAEALDRFEALDADVWFAGKRRNPHGHLAWHALVRQELPLDATLEGEAALAGASSGTAVPVQELFAQNPTLSTSYSRTLSAASVANLTSRVLHTARSEDDGGPIGLDDPIHDTYHPYEQIHTILNRFQDAFPGWVEVVTLGKSSEGRDIWAVKVTKSSSNAAASPQDVAREDDDDEEEEEEDGDDDDESVGPPPLFSSLVKKHKHRPGHGKFKFLIAGTQHSREWIAASTVLYLVHELVALDQQGKIPQRKLLEQVEFTFVPVVNPDGYVYAWEHDRLWRKSRQPVGGGGKSPRAHSRTTADDDDISATSTEDEHEECLGIDLNRNWGYQFQPGARPNPCSDSYPGAKAFESVELQALRTYMLDGVEAFLDVHSFGQMLLFPYSYSCDVVTPDQENHYEAVLQAAKALRDVHGLVFETGSVCEVSLTSPGESLDWAYAVAKIRWSFATELRDGGIFGFLLPPAQIRPSGEEMSAALRRLTQFILDKEAGKR